MKCPYPLLCKLFLIFIFIFIFSLFLIFCILLFIPRRYFVTFENRLDYQELKIARVKEIHGKINYCYAFFLVGSVGYAKLKVYENWPLK